MLKRLIIAVFALSLVLSLSGTAFSGESRPGGMAEKRNPVDVNHPNAAKFLNNDLRPQTPSQRADFNDPTEIQVLLTPRSKPVTPPSGYFCDVVDNSGVWGGAYGLPGSGGLRTSLAERFTSEVGSQCTIKGAYVYTHTFYFSGTPSLMVYLYDDDGFGLPGAKLDSFLFSNVCLVDSTLGCTQRPDNTDSGFVEAHAIFSNGPWTFDEAESWHIAVEEPTGLGGMAIFGDLGTGPTAGENRGSIYRTDIPGWTAGAPYFGGSDRAFAILAERCCGDQPFSDCYTQSYWANASYLWTAPDPVYLDEAYAQRFSVAGPESLKSVDVWVYSAATDPGVNLVVEVRDDDGFGLPGALVQSVTVPYTMLVDSGWFFPTPANVDLSSYNLVFENDFHVVITSDGVPGSTTMGFVTDDGTSAAGRGATRLAGVWYSLITAYGADLAFMVDANMCKDQFAVCTWNNNHLDALNTGFSLPYHTFGLFQEAQRFNASGGASCEIRDVQIYLGYLTADAARAPSMYSTNTQVSIYTEAGGFPGVNLGTITLTPADYVAAGNVGYSGSAYFWIQNLNFDPLNIQLVGDYFVVLTSLSSHRDSGIRMYGDADGNPPNLPGYVNSALVPGWIEVGNFFGGLTVDASFAIMAKHCCAPFAEYTCQTAQDWSTPAGNFARTSRTDVSLSDAYCDLNQRWYYEHPTQLIAFCGPVVYNGGVAQVWTGTLTKFNLLTGAIDWTKSGAPQLGTNMRCTPTAATVGGTDVLFTSGGNAQSVTCWNWATGAVIWNRPGPNGSGGGAARYGVFVLANQAGTDVLYTVSETGKLVAINAATGANYVGWGTNPVSMPGAADEVSLSYNVDANLLYVGEAPASGNGDVYAVDAATGGIVWQLSVAGPGLRAATLYTGAAAATGEQFTGYTSYEAGFLYANSKMNVSASAQFPADGIYYKINAVTGAIVHAALSQRMYRAAPVIDQNNIIIPTISVWATPSLGYSTVAISKAFGVNTWSYLDPSGGDHWLPAALTCEPGGAPDQLYSINTNGFMLAQDANTGAEVWNRRMEYGQVGGAGFRGFGVALSKDGELAVNHEFGGLAVLAKDVDRQRLHFIHYNYGGGVNFGTNPALPMNLGWAAKNTGCLPLNIISVTADAGTDGQVIPVFSTPAIVGSDLLTASAEIAAKMTANGWNDKVNGIAFASDNSFASFDKTARRETTNRAALAAPPAWFVSLDDPGAGDVILPGDSVELKITVNQNFITRGPNVAYIAFDTDDPDFFLNDLALDPEIKINLVGGCLTDTSTLTFGMGSANYEWVWNMGRLGDGDATAHGFHIDGDDAQYYQGSYIYAVSQRRYASNSADWSGATTLEWFSLQADPNWCDAACKPALVSPYATPAISNDGLTYTPIAASMVCRNYLDSVQFFDLGSGWSVENEPAGFDNDSTMGLYVRSRTIAATNEAQLSNVTIDLMDISERNGNAVTGWYMGTYNDYDIGGGDTSGIDKSVSTAYAWNKAAANGIWGQIKLPFGCGYTPIVNTHGMQGAQALYTPDQYFDSAYGFLSNPAAHTSQITTGGDFEQHNTFVAHDFTPNETFSYGVAHFGFPTGPHGGSGNTANATVKNLARLVNKWVGFGRGDVNNDNLINLADVVYLAANVNFGGPGAIPFAHLGDVNASGGIDQADVDFLINFYFNCGPCPTGDWTM